MKERYLLEDGSDNGFSLITDYDGNDEQAFDVNVKSGEILPVLPLRNMVLFPGVFLPITVGRKSSLKLIRDADLTAVAAHINNRGEEARHCRREKPVGLRRTAGIKNKYEKFHHNSTFPRLSRHFSVALRTLIQQAPHETFPYTHRS